MVLPLGGHDLGVDTGDVDTGVQAGLVVRLDDISAEDTSGSDTTVVRALGTGETVLGPAIWPTLSAEKSVFLLKTEPVLLALVVLHELVALVAEVVSVGLATGVPCLAHDEDIGS